MKAPLRLIFAGTPSFAQVALQSLIDNKHALNIDIVAVYTQPDRKAGRGQKLSPSPVKLLAQRHNIPVEQPISFSLQHEQGQVSRETLAAYRPDVMVVAAYGLILPLAVLTIPPLGCLNIHASLLPRFRGAAPIERAILAGDDITGITIMQMAKGLDTGDMLYQLTCSIDEQDNAQSLHDKLAVLGGQAMVAVLLDLHHYQKNAQPQDDSQANYAHKITSDDGQIHWQNDALSINRQIRALNAYSFVGGERLKIVACLPVKPCQSTHKMAGAVVGVGKNAILVACGDNDKDNRQLIAITQMQWAGGKVLTAEQIAVGKKLVDGEILG